jgi:hypothetical protein
VEEIDKPAGERCRHASREGCSIYEGRPTACRGFSCLWLLGFGVDRHRPDRSDVLLDVQHTNLGETVVVRELAPRALQKDKGAHLMRDLRRSGQGLYVKHHDGTVSIEGPQEFVERGAEIAAERGVGPDRVRLRILG